MGAEPSADAAVTGSTDAAPAGLDDQVRVGRIGRPHGVRGAVVVVPTTDSPEQRFAAGTVLRSEPGGQPLTVGDAHESGSVVIVSFVGVDDRDAAEPLRGLELFVPLAELPPLEDADDFYDHQLVGLAVRDPAGVDLGTIAEVLHPPAAPVLVVRRPSGEQELVPFVKAIVTAVDLARGVVVDPPEGMFG